jgi:hypothetical protein
MCSNNRTSGPIIAENATDVDRGVLHSLCSMGAIKDNNNKGRREYKQGLKEMKIGKNDWSDKERIKWKQEGGKGKKNN